MNSDLLQLGIYRDFYPRASVYYEAPSPNRLGVFVSWPNSRHDWQSELGSKRGLIFLRAANGTDQGENRAKLPKKPLWDLFGPCAAKSSPEQFENLGERSSAAAYTGRLSENPSNDLSFVASVLPARTIREVRA